MIPDYFPSQPDEYLRLELQFRQRRNPRYSIRAFARDLSLSPSHLSEFLSGKSTLSPRKVTQLASFLNLSSEQCEHWQDLLELQAKEATSRRKAKLRIQKRLRDSRSHVALDLYRVIADWQHFALLAFFGVRSSWTVRELAQHLRLPEENIRQAIRTLVKVDLLEKTDEGYRPVSQTSFSGDQAPSEAIRESHRQVLGKALEALDVFGMEDRMSQSYFLSVPQEKVKPFREALRRRTLETLSEFSCEGPHPSGESVLALTWHLFPLLRKETDQ